jgi:hypothetical protein
MPTRTTCGRWGCARGSEDWVLSAVQADTYSQGMSRVASLVAAACAVLLAACTAGGTPPPTGTGSRAQRNSSSAQAGRPTGPPPVQGAAYTSGGCGATPLLLGSAPRWASSANPPPIRYALAKREQVAGFLFGYPLMAGNPQPFSDKILWVVASARDGMPLRLTGHPLNAVKPIVSSTWPADSTPGEIYPSEIKVPAPGCWQFTLSWNGHTDTIDLWYVRHR